LSSILEIGFQASSAAILQLLKIKPVYIMLEKLKTLESVVIILIRKLFLSGTLCSFSNSSYMLKVLKADMAPINGIKEKEREA
jgi:hypothetical protein